ncbi:MAG: putative metal-binding motif-containing protein, partial [Myxococcota bacterium]
MVYRAKIVCLIGTGMALCACASAVTPEEGGAEGGDVLDQDAWFGSSNDARTGGGTDVPPMSDSDGTEADTSEPGDTAEEMDTLADTPPPLDDTGGGEEDTAVGGGEDTVEQDTAEEDTTPAALCGNGQRDPGEACDPALDALCPDNCQFNHGILCQPCDSDVSCGGSNDRCATLDDGAFCTSACVDDSWCPEGYNCVSVGDDQQGCVPERRVCGDCFDPDGDGYGIGSGCLGEDCRENDPNSSPEGAEVCDGFDNDCDNTIDEGVAPPRLWPDIDGDGFGSSAASPVEQCPPPERHVANNDDCNDGNRFIHPDAVEICDGQDNNCVGGVDEGLQIETWFDGDNDGYGDEDAAPTMRCGTDDNYADNNDDCDDSTEAIRPGAAEVCDGLDNDCDGSTDEDAATVSRW